MEKIQSNLDYTIDTLRKSIHKVHERGSKLNEIEKTSEEVLLSSEHFVIRVIPWYKRLWYYFAGFFCDSKKEEKEKVVVWKWTKL